MFIEIQNTEQRDVYFRLRAALVAGFIFGLAELSAISYFALMFFAGAFSYRSDVFSAKLDWMFFGLFTAFIIFLLISAELLWLLVIVITR